MQRLLKSVIATLVFSVLLRVTPACAQTFHVDGCAASPGDGSPSMPFNTLALGVEAAKATRGSSLMIRSGSYPALTVGANRTDFSFQAEGGPVQIGLMDDIHLAAVVSLMKRYRDIGSWRDSEDGWWYMTPSAMMTLIDFMTRTGHRCYAWVIADVFNKNRGELYQENGRPAKPGHEADFKNVFIDDSGWWGLAWVRAYDFTSDSRYLDAARGVANWMWERGMEDPFNPAARRFCNGGLWWFAEPLPPHMPPPNPEDNIRRVKNAITNELFIKLAASLHNRIPGDTVHLRHAQEVWEWLRNSKMMPKPDPLLKQNTGFIRDVLYDASIDRLNDPECRNDAAWFQFTPPQGIILGALVELYRATGNVDLLDQADRIANTATDATPGRPFQERMVYPEGSLYQGVLREQFEEQYACSDPATKTCNSDDHGVKFRRAPVATCDPADVRQCAIIDTANDSLNMSKGVFVRHLRELYDQNKALGRSTYTWAAFLKRQRESLIANAMVGSSEFFYFWTGPKTNIDFAIQASAIDALTAAAGL
jgi:hypothetical protein